MEEPINVFLAFNFLGVGIEWTTTHHLSGLGSFLPNPFCACCLGFKFTDFVHHAYDWKMIDIFLLAGSSDTFRCQEGCLETKGNGRENEMRLLSGVLFDIVRHGMSNYFFL